MVSLDLRKAFDTANHQILLKKMERLGIRGVCYEWFKNYLSNRKQKVSIDSCYSKELIVNCGVPQGSILGPTFFFVYINSISNLNMFGKLILYADDTALVYLDNSVHSIKNKIKADLTEMQKWLCAHKLTLNIEKLHYKIINKNIQFDRSAIGVGNVELGYARVVRYLGLLIEETLGWDAYLKMLRDKLLPPIGILSRLSYNVPARLLRTIYFSLIHSHLQYLTILWFTANISQIKSINNTPEQGH